ncbi:hypothetical protein NMZ80_06610 [Clostridioides difficile]|uniref:hypothetical protein n=1 Tax=Clostridioides difficile TaxID=1496 RepID=UPI0010B0FDC0|nr:hypothetical protein [Clostridioides difficile]EGT2204210.1 hypothetical protein [Clostridioides difficile]UUC43113.1 hypothetical protein NMZ80_06610 [Clostridioides difficile]VIF69149.1 Uncharacterised protein [Clostridioides difficile]
MQEVNFLEQSVITEPKEFFMDYVSLPISIPKLVSYVQNLVIHGFQQIILLILDLSL